MKLKKILEVLASTVIIFIAVGGVFGAMIYFVAQAVNAFMKILPHLM